MALYLLNFNSALRPDQKLSDGAFISGSIDMGVVHPQNYNI